MSIDNPNVTDLIGIDPATGDIILAITDGRDWSNPIEHMTLLGAKLQSYIALVSSGKLRADVPGGADRGIRIEVIGRFPIEQFAVDFLRGESERCAHLGVSIRSVYYPGDAGTWP